MPESAPLSILTSPDFTCAAPDCKFVAGVRPFRQSTFRLEGLQMGNKFVVHNYGHGGAGITMSWGCADAVREIVRGHSGPGPQSTVAILGGGVMGLTAAYLLKEAGYAISIYADSLTNTTSDVAGGQWAPSIVKFENKACFVQILRVAHHMHRQRLGTRYGVSERVNYCKSPGPGLEFIAQENIIPPATRLACLPFEHLGVAGWAYETLLVEPPIFLRQLRAELIADVQMNQCKFNAMAEVLNLRESIIVNCTGLGSGTLFQDDLMVPIKGQLVLLKAQPTLDYLYSSDTTYVFPRADHVVVGGSYEENVNNCVPDPVVCNRIRDIAEGVFAGQVLAELERESWMMRDK